MASVQFDWKLQNWHLTPFIVFHDVSIIHPSTSWHLFLDKGTQIYTMRLKARPDLQTKIYKYKSNMTMKINIEKSWYLANIYGKYFIYNNFYNKCWLSTITWKMYTCPDFNIKSKNRQNHTNIGIIYWTHSKSFGVVFRYFKGIFKVVLR